MCRYQNSCGVNIPKNTPHTFDVIAWVWCPVLRSSKKRMYGLLFGGPDAITSSSDFFSIVVVLPAAVALLWGLTKKRRRRHEESRPVSAPAGHWYVERILPVLTLPPKSRIEDWFGRLRVVLWGIFEILLLILAMIAVVTVAWKHIPTL